VGNGGYIDFGHWKNGKQDGLIRSIVNKQFSEYELKDGKKNGRSLKIYWSGAIEDCNYKDGNIHGKLKYINPGG
jgi:antitoxin component YwqK of YwqJK toxin-antitoxin module